MNTPQDRQTGTATDDTPRMLPRAIHSTMTLAQQDHTDALIVFPGHLAGYATLANRLAECIRRITGAWPATVTDEEILPQRGMPLPDAYRQRPLIILGSINTNRLLVPLYARFLCATDATYPGGDGYDLRTMVNSYGTGVNNILAGGSTLRGVERAVERLCQCIDAARGADGVLTLPFLLHLELAADLERALANWPYTPLDKPLPTDSWGLMHNIASYGILYAWSGNPRYGEVARDCLRAVNTRMAHSYGDWHYEMESIVRALPWLAAGGFLEPADLQRTDDLLLGTNLETQDMWWRMKENRPPLGHRHQSKGTYAFFLTARYLRDQACPNAPVRTLCDRWINESHVYLDACARARIDDQNEATSMHSIATLVWYALGEERYGFFESGNARLAARRAIATHDNLGATAGLDAFHECGPGGAYLPVDVVALVGASAFYYGDGQQKWIREQVPHLQQLPYWLGYWNPSPMFMHKYDTGPELTSIPAKGLVGLHRLPLSDYQYEISTHPPEHIVPLGHFANEPETWLQQGGVGPNTLPQERTFEKLSLRGGFARDDVYLLLEGYQGGWRFQGSAQAANTIVRYTQAGHIFLVSNSDRQSPYHRNGLLISDGYNATPMPPLAEWLAGDDFADNALSATRLSNVHHTDWTRHIFWCKEGGGFFVVMDTVAVQKDGFYSATCTWRTPGYAELDGRRWQARQGDHRFTVCCSQSLAMTSEEQGMQGAVNPYVLRQRQGGAYRAGDLLAFQNLFYVRPHDTSVTLDSRYLGPTQAIITQQEGSVLAWLGVSPQGQEQETPFMQAQAVSALVTPDGIALAGARRVAIDDGLHCRLQSDRPIGLHVDLPRCQLVLQVDGATGIGASVQVDLDGRMVSLAVREGEPCLLPLPPGECRNLATAIRRELAVLGNAARPTPQPHVPLPQADLPIAWHFANLPTVPERVRDVTIHADPKPVDGFSERLIDTVVPGWRSLGRQWPDAPEYHLTLELGQEHPLESLRVIGDNVETPTLLPGQHPLPQGITVSVSGDDFQKDMRPLPTPTEERWEGRMQALRFPVAGPARQVRLRIPAPAGNDALVLYEIELYGQRRVNLPLKKMMAADLDSDGQKELVIATATDEVIVLADNGSERWRWQAPSHNHITHLSCHNLDGDGRHQICIGLGIGLGTILTVGTTFTILENDGSVRRSLSLDQFNQEGPDLFAGRFNWLEGAGVWHRGKDGRASLVVGGWNLLAFMDPDGNFLGHCWAEGAGQGNILAVPPKGSDAPDIWARNRWHQGITVYEGRPGLAHSGEGVIFGGRRQPMFRPGHKVIPFVPVTTMGGENLAFAWIGPEDDKTTGLILAACENGVGVLSPTKEDFIWKVEGGTLIQACSTSGVDGEGEAEVVTGGADGFLAAFGLRDGRPKRSRYLGAPITGVIAWPKRGTWLVGTTENLLLLDECWQIVRAKALPVARLCALGESLAAVSTADGRLEAVSWEGH